MRQAKLGMPNWVSRQSAVSQRDIGTICPDQADRIKLAMASEDASLVFVRAFLLAQKSKAPEIRIEHLLAALDEGMPLAVESSSFSALPCSSRTEEVKVS